MLTVTWPRFVLYRNKTYRWIFFFFFFFTLKKKKTKKLTLVEVLSISQEKRFYLNNSDIYILSWFCGYRNMNMIRKSVWLVSETLFVHNISCSSISCKYVVFFSLPTHKHPTYSCSSKKTWNWPCLSYHLWSQKHFSSSYQSLYLILFGYK